MGTLGTGDKGGWIRLGGHGVEEESAKETGKRKKNFFFIFDLFLWSFHTFLRLTIIRQTKCYCGLFHITELRSEIT